MLKRLIKYLLLVGLILLISVVSYNYYYYYKSLRLNKDIYNDLKVVVDNFSDSLEYLNDNDIPGFLNNSYKTIKYSNYLRNRNHKIYSNFFVKLNMLDGSFFSNEVSDALLWFNELNIRLNRFHVLNNELFNSDILVKKPEKAMENVKNIKSTILEFNSFLSTKNQNLVEMMEDQKLDEEYFNDLEEKIQLSYKFFEVIDNFMGAKDESKSLVLVQNSHNMNQSGGKWVYYMMLTCDKYVCSLSEIDFVSNLTSAMVDKLIPPEEIRTKKTIWIYEDLGWFFDFNETANLALKYYPIKTEFDNVVAFDISIFDKIFKGMPNVDFNIDDEKVVINSNNVVDFLLGLSVYDSNKELTINSEKLSLFWDSFKKSFNQKYFNSNLKDLISDVYIALGNKNMQLYSSKNIIQSLKDLGYNNSLRKVEEVEYFAVSKSNILENVFDKDVDFKVDLEVTFNDDWSISNTSSVLVENNINSRIRNTVISYFQFYFNKGSSLISTSFPSKIGEPRHSTVDYDKHGFIVDKKIDNINTKTAYLSKDDVRVYEDGNFLITGGWVTSLSKQSKKIEINWDSNYTIDKDEKIYRLFVQKQPNVDYVLSLKINYPSDVNGVNVINKNININSDKLIEIKLD